MSTYYVPGTRDTTLNKPAWNFVFLVETGDKSKQINMIWGVVSVVKIKELRSSDPRRDIFLCLHPSSSPHSTQEEGGQGVMLCAQWALRYASGRG